MLLHGWCISAKIRKGEFRHITLMDESDLKNANNSSKMTDERECLAIEGSAKKVVCYEFPICYEFDAIFAFGKTQEQAKSYPNPIKCYHLTEQSKLLILIRNSFFIIYFIFLQKTLNWD